MESLNLPSPIQSLVLPLSREKGIHIDVKRDDMIHPFISGNKWRKLKYIIEKVRKDKRNHLVTFGGAWSNHVLATACLAASTGFRSTAYIRGERVENPILYLCELFGMQLHFISREAYKQKERLFDLHHRNDPEAFFIDEGGFSPEATKGCEELVGELASSYQHIFCACGTGATLAGIAQGAAKWQKGARVHGIPVLKGGGFIHDAVRSIYPNLRNIHLHTDYHFGGYAKSRPPLLDFVKRFCSTTGLLIEPVYTGKVFFAVMDLMEKNYFTAGDRILVVHTGGILGILGQTIGRTKQ